MTNDTKRALEIIGPLARCGFCQTQVERKDKFCRFCGRKLTT